MYKAIYGYFEKYLNCTYRYTGTDGKFIHINAREGGDNKMNLKNFVVY